jgi:steroid 5-alpha reductase family enzyme
MLRAGQLYI